MQAFEINGPNVVAETIDGEVVIVNLDSGSYYSIRGIGAVVWGAVCEGYRADKIEQALSRLPGEDRTDLAPHIHTFIDQLVSEQLLRLSDRNCPEVPLIIPPGDYCEPVLEKFSDMEALLLLDPIHDVDERGWPRVT